MAWNVVIAGGGFGGATAARELERIDAEAVGAADAGQRRQLHALHAVPARGGGGDAGAAARGHAAARDPQAHLPAAGRDRRPRPRRPHGRAAQPRRRDRGAALRPAAARARLGLAGAAGPRPRRARDRLQEPRRRDLAAQPRDRDARGRQRDRGPGPPRGAAHLRLRRRRLRRPRGARRAPGLRRRRDRAATRAPACTGCAGSWSRRPTGSCPRSTPSSPTTRCASCAAAASTSASARRWRRSTADTARLSTGETLPTRTVVWTAGVAPHPSLRRAERAARRARPRPGRRPPAGRGHGRRSGRSATAPPSPTRAAALCPPTAQHAVRQGPVAARNIAAELGIGSRGPSPTAATRAFVNLGRYKAVGRIGGRTFRGFPAWWLARTYHMSQIPGLARKVRAVIDWTAGLPFRRDISEVGSIGHPKPLISTRVREKHRCTMLFRGLVIFPRSIPPSRSCASLFPRVRGGSTRGGISPPAGRSWRRRAAASRFRGSAAVRLRRLRAAG